MKNILIIAVLFFFASCTKSKSVEPVYSIYNVTWQPADKNMLSFYFTKDSVKYSISDAVPCTTFCQIYSDTIFLSHPGNYYTFRVTKDSLIMTYLLRNQILRFYKN